jgi:hypothetical protein
VGLSSEMGERRGVDVLLFPVQSLQPEAATMGESLHAISLVHERLLRKDNGGAQVG